MNQAQKTVNKTQEASVHPLVDSYYAILGLHPAVSPLEIRRTYRELSKQYHPDTTELPPDVAIVKFQQLNEAYATLSNPERRALYDLKIGYSRINVIQAPTSPSSSASSSSSRYAYIDPTDRPLSSGEIFVLFVLGLTFLSCLLLAVFVGLTRGEEALKLPSLASETIVVNEQIVFPHQLQAVPFIDRL
ncbi:MAG: J domain-containing protein [Cyanophyceae cyanobacterium]